jgi:hypothetical protein
MASLIWTVDKSHETCLIPSHQEAIDSAEKLAKRVTLHDDEGMEEITTRELVARLRNSGLSATPEKLRVDVHRGLLSPYMPRTVTPGRGVPAHWSPMSICRARRIARLRKRGVKGHVLPLLLFLADGWGWEQILPDLQKAVAKAWALDRSYLNKPNRVRTPDDLLDNAQDAEEWIDHPDHRAIVDLRSWLYSQGWYGKTQGNASPIPFMITTLPNLLGVKPTEEQQAQAQSYVARREALQLPTSDLQAWLGTLDHDAVERGRAMFWDMVRFARLQRRKEGLPGTNPLTMGGETPSKIAAYFRARTGRMTPAQVLGVCIAQAMVMGAIALEIGNLHQQGE